MKHIIHHRYRALAICLLAMLLGAIQPANAAAPVANYSKSTGLSGVSPLSVHFDASLSSCSNGCTKFDSYQWAIASGPTLSGITADYQTNTVGTRSVVLTVKDDTGLKSTATFNIVVSASTRSPVAKIDPIASNVKGAIPLSATFDANSSICDNGCSTFVWNYGEGPIETGTSAWGTHSYTKAGTYNATVTVTDGVNGKKNSASIQVIATPAESLATYVQSCQSQLNFTNISIPNLNCFDGDLFDARTPKNDYLVYKKITDQVDVAVACRWVTGDRSTGTGVSAEMLVHNRSSGNTCFFSAKHPNASNAVSVNIISPTDPAAGTFWDNPASVDANVRCIGCHIEGPYIATPLIAPYLAKNGLLNNGHDTGSAIVSSDFTGTFNKAHVKYHAISALVNNVPGAFSQWDNLKQSYFDPVETGCALGCHVVGTLSPQHDIDIAPAGNVLFNPHQQLQAIDDAGVMAPYDDASDYRWINLAIPDGGSETETFFTAKNASNTLVPTLLNNCSAPSMMYAHVVGSDNQFVVSQSDRFTFLPDRLSVFNLKDGLICLNSDQDPGQSACQDYTVQYECTNNTTRAKSWTNLPNHLRQSDGDREPRPANVCASGSTATGIKALFTLSNGWTYSAIGPNDRLAAMSQYGITCNNASQPDNKCSNYVVSYHNCGAAPATQLNKTLTNENTTAGSKQLTAASGSLTKGQIHNNGWNTQAWTIEPVTNTEYVRLRNPGTNVYLNVSSQSESATVGTASFNGGWTSEMWLIEPVANSSYVRLKNLWTGKYLTMADPNTVDAGSKDYLPVYSQGRNTSWNTQRWLIQ